jgi:ubiquinone biosynthesis protein Coq4
MCAQTPNRGIAFIIFMARRKFRQEAPEIDVDACVAEGRRIGKRAKWFATVDWEQRLAEPLQRLREELGVSSPSVYREALRARVTDCCASA